MLSRSSLASLGLLLFVSLAAHSAGAAGTDVLVNDRTGDPATTADTSPSIAAIGDTVVAVWQHQAPVANSRTFHSAESTDGGATFKQLGVPPLPAGWSWDLDPRLIANQSDGGFYVAGRLRGVIGVTGSSGGIGVVRGIPTSGSFVWQTPVIVDLLPIGVSTIYIDGDALDFAVRKSDGQMYLIYNSFGHYPLQDSLRFRSCNPGGSWSSATLVATSATDSPMNPRIACTADKQVVAVWNEESGPPPALKFKTATTSDDGVSFTPPSVIRTGILPYAEAPNLAILAKTSLAIASDPNYTLFSGARDVMMWTEPFDAFTTPFAAPGAIPGRSELGANDTTTTATPFTMGQTLHGAFTAAVPFDVDFYSFSAIAGERYSFLADSGGSGTDPTTISFRIVVVGPDGRSWIESASGSTSSTSPYFVLGFSPPTTGTYYLRLYAATSDPSALGGYRVRTALDSRPITGARDQRDMLVSTYDPDLASWAAPLLSNAFEPVGYENNCLALHWSDDGNLYAGWYDWQSSPGTAISRYRLSRGRSFGTDWDASAIVSRVTTDWMNVTAPNLFNRMNRMTSVSSGGNKVYSAWTDGRLGDCDIYLRAIRTDITLVSCQNDTVAAPGQTLQMPSTLHNYNEVYTNRISYVNTIARYWPPYIAVSYFDIAPSSNATDVFTIHVPDTAVAGLVQIQRQFSNGSVCRWKILVDPSLLGVTPVKAGLEFEPVAPNPSSGATRMAFTLPQRAHAAIDIIDPSGRRVRSILDGTFEAGRHQHVWDGIGARGERTHAGVYWARLRVGANETLTRRFVLLR